MQRIDYDEFGRMLTNTNPGFQPFGFAADRYDDDTALVRCLMLSAFVDHEGTNGQAITC